MKLSENTSLTLDVRTLVIIIGFTVSMVTMYMKLQSDIKLAMESPPPTLTAAEWTMKDQLIRKSIEATLIATNNNTETLKEIKEKLNTLEDRIYEINK
tara:strand:- start:1137 stop:1430 length:294 start_codon:yes stop_codon:yes gene_type:complete